MLYYFAIIFSSLIVLLIIISDIMCRRVIFPTPLSLSQSEKIEKDAGNWNNYDSLDKEDLNFILNDGYLIHGTLIWNNRNSNKFVIITHGFKYNRFGSIKYLDTFKNNDYNVYIYDLRSHGNNEKGIISMGNQESKDLNQLINLFRKNFQNNIILALHGESLGAFSSLLVLSYNPDIKFVVSDCSYSDTINELKHQMKNHKIPLMIFPLISFIAKVKYNQNWKSLDAREVLKKTKIPILFIHGEDDTFTPPHMAKELYLQCSSKKELVYFNDAKHAQCRNSNPSKYTKIVTNFINSL